MRPVLFLDIDGVLNGHVFHPQAQSNTIDPACVAHLNKVIADTDCALVISSAWRYMVLLGSMTLKGFEHLLRTHGVNAKGRVIGTTGRGEENGNHNDRVRLIRNWLKENPTKQWAVVDDMNVGMERLVQTSGSIGLTGADAERLISMLRRGP